mmetsp:Transcript_42117/g.110977  ORF Transcript_42117/g.110977 Transcript_42117/m.110977 type:complete len:293 (+) Transcript_42117:245-1123(+)
MVCHPETHCNSRSFQHQFPGPSAVPFRTGLAQGVPPAKLERPGCPHQRIRRSSAWVWANSSAEHSDLLRHTPTRCQNGTPEIRPLRWAHISFIFTPETHAKTAAMPPARGACLRQPQTWPGEAPRATRPGRIPDAAAVLRAAPPAAARPRPAALSPGHAPGAAPPLRASGPAPGPAALLLAPCVPGAPYSSRPTHDAAPQLTGYSAGLLQRGCGRLQRGAPWSRARRRLHRCQACGRTPPSQQEASRGRRARGWPSLRGAGLSRRLPAQARVMQALPEPGHCARSPHPSYGP